MLYYPPKSFFINKTNFLAILAMRPANITFKNPFPIFQILINSVKTFKIKNFFAVLGLQSKIIMIYMQITSNV